MKITLVAGARPNFMKIAPIIHAIHACNTNGGTFTYRLVHTGQHYDKKMSDTFFEELEIPHPDANLEAGGGTQAEQTAAVMVAFEKDLINNPTDLVLVVGDVTSTMACTITAKKLNVKVAHVEAGIRSFDLTMPEEINRMVTDSITDYFFTTSEFANSNLKTSGVPDGKVFFVGNVMIDTLLRNLPNLKEPAFFKKKGLSKQNYFVLTLHRPSNVDQATDFKTIVDNIVKNSNGLPIIFPIHPRTAKVFKELDIQAPNLHIVDPMGYLEFNYIVKNAKAVITDSGGITEEATVLGIPCITLRSNTERPETVTIGTNELVGTDPIKLAGALSNIHSGKWKKGELPPLWDGKAAERIINAIQTK